MREILIQILAVTYAGVGVAGIIAYWPTIKDLLSGRPSANTLSYFLWTLTSTVTLLYALFVLHDLLFRLVSGLYFFANGLIFILRLKISKKS